MRPTDLAREHGLSTQAVRNYERDGFLPPAERTPSGYRIYTEVHAAALRTYLALVPAFGHATGGRIMAALHDGDLGGDLDYALTLVDRGHEQLLRDRETLASVRSAVEQLTAAPAPDTATRTIGELARRLRVTPATLRNWENAGILTPSRDRGGRVYRSDDIRDAELAHLLRRGGYPLRHISTVVHQVRTAGGTASLAEALDDWRERLTAQGLSMLRASAQLARYLTVFRPG